MFTPLDICIRLSSAVNYSVKSKFEGRTTWSSVKDSREERAAIDVMVADNAPFAFCKVEMDCFRIGDRKKRVWIEVFVDMHLDDGNGLDLGKFPVERMMQEVWNFYPSLTIGTRYNIDYSREKGPELKAKKTMNVRLGAFYGEFSTKELEELDFEEVGDEIAEHVGVMNAMYLVAKQITASTRFDREDPSNLGGG